MCTVLACDGQFVVAAGESDDGSAGAEQPGVLHGVTTEPTDAVDHHRAARTELSRIAELLHPAVGSQPRIRQRR